LVGLSSTGRPPGGSIDAAAHGEFQVIAGRFVKRAEALDLSKGGGMDLARRLAEAHNNGVTG
jgi:hypothetical protein